MMKLYTTAASPFGARVIIQVQLKSLPVSVMEPPAPPGAEELKSLSPLLRVPILDCGDSVIVESEIIQEYLQEKFPDPDLLGRTPEETALIRTLSRMTDLYLLPAMQPLRSRLRDKSAQSTPIDNDLAQLQKVFFHFEHFMQDGDYAVANTLSLADCSMAPLFNYLAFFASVLDIDLPTGDCPRLESWMHSIRKDETVEQVLCNMETARQPAQ